MEKGSCGENAGSELLTMIKRFTWKNGGKDMNLRGFIQHKKRWLLFLGEEILLAALLDFLFYKEFLAMIPLLALALFHLKQRLEGAEEDDRKQLEADFREALNAMSVSLRAGTSLDHAVPETAAVLSRVLGNENQLAREFYRMTERLRVGIPVEKQFRALADRSGSRIIENFSEVLTAAKRMGGNLPVIIRRTAEQIELRLETEEEIRTVLAAKALEQKIMTAMPLGILLYLQLTSPEYLSVLYHSILGAGVMTACLLVWIGSALWGQKIVRVEI